MTGEVQTLLNRVGLLNGPEASSEQNSSRDHEGESEAAALISEEFGQVCFSSVNQVKIQVWFTFDRNKPG